MHKLFSTSNKVKNGSSFDLKLNSDFSSETLATQIIFTYLLTDERLRSSMSNDKYNTILDLAENYANGKKHADMYYIIARAYDKKGISTNDKKLNEKAKMYYEKALALFPNRQEYLFPYAFNFISLGDFVSAKKIIATLYQSDREFPDYNFYYGIYLINEGEEKYGESLTLMEKAFSSGFEIIDTQTVSDSYSRLFMYFYKKNDIENLEIVAFRLSSIDNVQKETINNIYNYLKTTKKIPRLQFQEE